jgi:glycosyltransferase involved in cell wall biosynthesis
MADVGVAPRQTQAPLAPGRAEKVVVVMPAWNAEQTIERTVRDIPREWVDEVIVVDDSSTDGTVDLAEALPVHVIRHPHNVGYGGNQKTCYLQALQHDADVVVMLHPDGQYEPSLIPQLVQPILRGEADLVLGSRLMVPGAALAGGMPLWKYAANRFLTAVENAVLGTGLAELHTGYRAYSRELLQTIPFLRNALDFSFDSEVIMQAVAFGFRIHEVPARTIYADDASSVGLRDGVVYGCRTLWAALRFRLHRGGVWRSSKFVR